MDDNDWFTLEELTGRIGGLVWVEEQLGDLLGFWLRVESDDATAVYLATASGHHRWHAEVLRKCLPTSPKLGAEHAVRPPTDGWDAAVVTLRKLNDPDATVARLRSLVKVLHPWVAREIGALVELARPVSDAPMSRWLRFVTIDHDDDGQAAVELLAAHADDAVRFDEHVLVNELSLD